MTKVLYILQDHNPFSGRANVIGGHIAHIIGVVEAFQRLGHRVTIASFDRVPYWDNQDVRYWQFKTREIPVPKFGAMLRQWQLTNQIILAIQEEKPDFLYVRWTANLFFRRVRTAFPYVPIVMECNTASEMHLGIKRASTLQKWVAHKIDETYVQSATLISAVSAETRDFLLIHHPSLDPHRVITNWNGVDTTRFRQIESGLRSHYSIPQHVVVIGYAGNFCAWHRIDLLIRAFQGLGLDDVYLMIMGTGQVKLEESLRSVAETNRLSQIIFTGPVPFDQMPEHLSACDILVSPQSSSIGDKLHQSPIKLFEYMAVERAVVGSLMGQISKVVEDGRNGLLFEPDSREDLERVLKRLIENPALRRQLGQTARSDVEKKHSWKANVSRILETLDDLKYAGEVKEPQYRRVEFAKLNSSHKTRLEHLYQDIKFPDAIDWWTGHYAQNEMDVAVSNARHLDPARQAIEDEVWRRIVPVGGHVLDLACGRGFFSQRLLNALDGKAKITGFDLSEAILRVALSEQEGIPFVLGNAERLPFSESVFDAILVVSAFEHMENPRPVIREICRVLKSQGYLYICLHKPFVDPFVLPGVAMGSLRLIKRLFQPAISKDKASIGYKGTLRELRRNMRAWLSRAGFEWMESRALLHQMDWIFYKKAVPWAVPALIRLGQRLNRLPFRYYKDLEYWLLQKP